jgi:1-acyl-sn-glycerol-3-phosphate acyltransferase
MKLLNLFLNLIFWGFFVLSSLVLVVFAAIIRLVTFGFDPNRKILQKFSCFWASLYLWVNPFWSARIYGLENVDRKKPYVMVSNHQSMADILVVFHSFLHFKWVSKKELFKLPILGWNMRLNGYIPIERGDEKSREKCLALCRKWLEKGSSVFFFPEGTRSIDGKMKLFKPGAFRVALETNTDILPMVIRGSREAIPKHSLLLHGKSLMELWILPPIATTNIAGESLDERSKRLANLVFENIQTFLERSPT